MHVKRCGSIETMKVRCQYGLVNTLGLYLNALEYTELLNGLIFDSTYGSLTLSSILWTLAESHWQVML